MAEARARLRVPAPLVGLALVLGALACASEPEGARDLGPAAGERCAGCHAEEARALRSDVAHRAQPAGCLACHGDHADGAGRGAVELHSRCEDCHAAARARFALPFHHPLGPTFGCTDCHPPHGLRPRKLREHLRRDVCQECHREYDGPFQFEHEGDRNWLCLSCHEPHGSANRRLLTHSETRMLCMSCHINLEASHLQNPGSDFRECLRCHTEIHGSQWDPEFFR